MVHALKSGTVRDPWAGAGMAELNSGRTGESE